VYAGSFDPLTNGHLDVIRRGAGLFDTLVVAIGENPAKRYWFGSGERRALIEQTTRDAGIENVEVHGFSGLLVDFCRAHEAGVILRGLRSAEDFGPEFRYGLANRDLSGVETLFLLSDPQHLFVSSSLVKEIFGNGGDVSSYVPESVMAALAARGR
jgi:pantetheine-phosphate adenylyltransferase